MLNFSDERWNGLEGGYRTPYDPRPALNRLVSVVESDDAWSELWEGLFHQGDVGVASYATVPHLVALHEKRGIADWNTFALAGAIEQAKHYGRNPAVPDWLSSAYEDAWVALPKLALKDLSRSQDRTLIRSALGVIATASGLGLTGEILLGFTEDELKVMVDQYRETTT